MRCEIQYEDREILVIRKPAGLATQTASVACQDVVSELKNYLAKAAVSQKSGRPGEPYLGVIHRLDQPVEGLLIFAKTPKAAAELTKQLAKGTLNKRYYALVSGEVSPKAGELVDYLWKDQTNTARVVTGREKEFPQAKYARLTYQVMEESQMTAQDMGVSLLDITIETGRFHQIRAQLSHAGHPLLGDRKYKDQRSDALSDLLNIKNTALCAYQLEVRHPVSGKNLCWKILPEAKAFTIIKP